MTNRFKLVAALLSVLAVGVCLNLYSEVRPETATGPQESQISAAKNPAAKQPAVDLSARPTSDDAVAQARFAWYLFVQAMKPQNGSLAFESWTEQCQLNPAMAFCPSPSSVAAAAKRAGKGRVRIPHGSALQRKILGTKAKVIQPGDECNGMATAPVGGFPPPANVTATATFCEEVFVNTAEAGFVKKSGLTTLSGQQTYGNAHGGAITFPWTAVEIKADWVPVSSYSNPTFACPDPTHSLYTETINGTCYALVGLHISSKVLPDWLWATFEPNSNVTNPNRCDPSLYSTCFDPWGTTSSQPYGKGHPAQQSPQLHQAMAAAHLNPAFNNYFLTGAQSQFVSNGKPVLLGSSFVEFNAGVFPGQASCITCHRYAYFDGKQPLPSSPTYPAENNFGGPPVGWASVGYACNQPNPSANCTPVTPNSTSQDFSWMLGLMPYGGAGAKSKN
jgi:hypothetical protein